MRPARVSRVNAAPFSSRDRAGQPICLSWDRFGADYHRLSPGNDRERKTGAAQAEDGELRAAADIDLPAGDHRHDIGIALA